MLPENKTLSYKTDRPVLKMRTFLPSLSYFLGRPVLIIRTFWPISYRSLSGFLGHYRDLTISPRSLCHLGSCSGGSCHSSPIIIPVQQETGHGS